MIDTLIEEPFMTLPLPEAADREEPCRMTLVSSIIRPESLDAVTDALDKQHIVGMTVTDVRGFGRQKGQIEHYRGEPYTIRLLPKLKVDVVVQVEQVEQVLAAVGRAAHTGQIGDGKVFVLEVSQAMRIRTGDRGVSAL